MSVASWLSSDVAAAASAQETIGADVLDELRGDVDDAVRAPMDVLRSQLGADALPVRMPKGRLADLQRCERFALARARQPSPVPVGLGALTGIALDHFVAHQLLAGRVLEPVRDLTSILTASADHDGLALMRAADPDQLADALDAAAAAVARSWADVDPAWMPRVQSRATFVFAGGDAVCGGRVDVELGGPPSSRPGVLIEVKSGAATSSHADEVYLYALLVALRDRRAPAMVARWYPGAEPSGVPVSLGMLESAARRLVSGFRVWAELHHGRAPAHSPGPWCSWCPDAGVCPSSGAAPREEHAPTPEAPGGCA